MSSACISASPRAELAEVLERCAKPVEDDLLTRREMFEICDDGQRVVFNYNDLFLRPIRQWNPERVKEHVSLCALRHDHLRGKAMLDTIKVGKLNIDGKVVEQLSPVSQTAKKLLAAAGAKLNQAAKRQLGLADEPCRVEKTLAPPAPRTK